MHEFSLTQTIVAIATDHAQGQVVTHVTLEIGQLSAVMADAIRFCFDVCTQGTPLDGAQLIILEIPGRARCHLSFDVNQCIHYAHQVNPQMEVLQVSATTGKGLKEWYRWIEAQQKSS